MNCNQCGKELPDNSVFCPFCGVPQKVTADYDYIQGEIGANVDKIKTGGGQRNAAQKKRHQEYGNNDMYKTRNIYGNDTIYDEDRQVRGSAPQPRRRADNYDRRYDNYGRNDRYDRYDDYDDYYEYEDWGMEPSRGGNGKTILTTVIIAIICLAGIAAIIYFGLKPQERMNAVDVVRLLNTKNVEVSEGEEFDGKVELVLVSEQGYDIHYTLDGSDVDINSPVYSDPISTEEEGSLLIKAQSFDSNGNPSGEALSKTIVVVKEPETKKKSKKKTTAAEEETVADAAITKEEAEKVVESALIESGAMGEDYGTENGGFINLIHAGQAAINEADYYVVQADYYDSEGSIWETSYYGVSTQDGSLAYLDKQEDTFVIVE